jgi:branched-chain amino acid transport system ATP-binding protein
LVSALLRVENVSAGYGSAVVIRDISLCVEAGETVALLGPNGAGKTTLLKTIAGVVRVRKGTVTLGEHQLHGRRPDQIARRGIASVPESRRVFSLLTVKENLLLASRAAGQQKHTDEDLGFVYDVFPVLRERSTAKGNELSGGQQQMVALARAVMQRPSAVLLDEPSVGLSPLIVQQLPVMIRGVQERTGAAMLLTEQDVGVALALASRGYVMRGGGIVFEGSRDELAQSSSVLVESYLGAHSSGARSPR